jgi:hypothetical protein
MMVNPQSSAKIALDRYHIQVFIDKNTQHFANKGTCRDGVIPASKNLPWKTMKESLQQAGVGPLCLALRNKHAQ